MNDRSCGDENVTGEDAAGVPPSPVENLSLLFPRSRRLRRTQDFERVFASGQRAGDEHLVVFAAGNQLGTTRIGLRISRRHGNSVVRHRLRRLLKEAYRLEQHQIAPGLDLILVPGRLSRTSTLADYRQAIVELAGRLARRLLT
jgi:ribonuclease P protein component